MKKLKKQRQSKNTHKCSAMDAAVLIQNYHHDRLEKYAETKEISLDKSIGELIIMHQRGVNVAKHISATIGENHDTYREFLSKLGENLEFIR